jgi:endonuclease/exonuclease/phosphatase family metal-dependent hydrolase
MAANLTSGNGQDYDGGEGIRIMRGCRPDIVMVQEFAYKTCSPADYQEMANLVVYGSASVTTPAYYWQEGSHSIPNGIISRYPILASGEWDDSYLSDRDFAWARVDIPGPIDLWIVSIHIKASSSAADKTKRRDEAALLASFVTANVPNADYLAVGGDFNTYSSDPLVEPCLGFFDDFLALGPAWPADAKGNVNTNSGRTSPYDRVLVDADLEALKAPVILGSATFPDGLVVDTRIQDPLSEISPALATDSAAINMQHMGVVRDFLLPPAP